VRAIERDRCPADNALAELALGVLTGEDRRTVEAHLDGCRPCRQLVAELAKLSVLGAHPIAPTEPAQAPSVAAPLPGMQIGRYTVIETIGSGGMGIVVAAHDPTLDRTVAIKWLKAQPELTVRARLRKEARAMARLAHPNVVAVYEVGEWLDQDFVAMEYVEGEDVAHWLARDRRSWREVLDVFVAAGRGLEAAHAAGMVHRDIKPSNLLLGRDGRVRVTDFGLAHQVGGGPATVGHGAAAVGATLTEPHAGTPAYMAPEQFLGHGIDHRTDQFALCVSLYEGLYGVRPFAAAGTANPAIPTTLRAAVLRGLSTEPADRFGSVGALLDALQASASSLDATAPAPDPSPVARARGRRNLGIAAAVVIAAGAAVTWRALGGSDEPARLAVATLPIDASASMPPVDASVVAATAEAATASVPPPGARDATPARPAPRRTVVPRVVVAPARGSDVVPAPAVDAGVTRPAVSRDPFIAKYDAQQAIAKQMTRDLAALDPAIVKVRASNGYERSPCLTWSPSVVLAPGTTVRKQQQLANAVAAYVIRVQGCLPAHPAILASFDGEGWLPLIAHIEYDPSGAVRRAIRGTDTDGNATRSCCERREPMGTIRDLAFVAD
jgi:serine/threonine-protein kinase